MATADPAAPGERGFAYQPALDGLRAMAVIGVVLYHLGYGWASGGFLGVDTFFVLSGYLITSLLLIEWRRSGRISLREFWIRRARRLLPALFLMVTAVAIWAGIVLRPDQLGALRGDGLATLLYGANWRFISSGQSYFDLFSTASPLRHTWSLAIEEQFYLVWPLVVLAALRLGRGRLWLLAVATAALATGSIIAMALLHSPGADPSRAYYGTDTRAHSLLIGVLLALLLHRWSPRGAPQRTAIHVGGVIGLVLVIGAFARVSDRADGLYHGGSALFAVLAVVVIASAVVPGRSPVRAVLSAPPLVWVGKVSYGLYLWHWPVQIALNESRTGLGGVPLDLTRIGVTSALTILSYFFVEQPIRQGTRGRAWVLRGAPIAAVGVAGALVVATIGATGPPVELRTPDQRTLDQVLSALPVATTPPSTNGVPATTSSTTVAPSWVPRRIVWAGDSVAASLAEAIVAEGAKRGVEVTSMAFPGCGMVRGLPSSADFVPVDWAALCEQNIPPAQDKAAATGFDTITWLSSWETADRIVDGHDMVYGSPDGDAVLLSLIDESVQRLTAAGARVVFLTVPPGTSGTDRAAPSADEDERVVHLNTLLTRYAREHPTAASVVDFAAIVCPTGPPCPPEVDGVTPRPRDGHHFSGPGMSWVASAFFDDLFDAG